MGRWAMAVLLLAALAAPARAEAPREGAGTEELKFYGLRFGMSPEEVKQVFSTNAMATEVLQPGHGMLTLSLSYDYRNRLSEIRAGYERPADRLKETALRQALRERFQQPIAARWRSVTVDIDESWNRGALTLVLLSGDLRQEAVEHFKSEFLRQME